MHPLLREVGMWHLCPPRVDQGAESAEKRTKSLSTDYVLDSFLAPAVPAQFKLSFAHGSFQVDNRGTNQAY